MLVRWFEPAMNSILDREYNNYYFVVGGAVVAPIDF